MDKSGLFNILPSSSWMEEPCFERCGRLWTQTNSPAGRRWRHVCWQASVKTQPAGSYTAVPHLPKHRQSIMNGGLFSLSPPLCMLREMSLRVLPGPEFIASWLHWGWFEMTRDFLAEREDWHNLPESFKDVFTKDKCVFVACTRLFQTAKGSQEKP